MSASTRAAHGPRHLPEVGQSTTAAQAAWRFLNNGRVTLQKLIEPLRQLGREGCAASDSPFVLLVHDFCKLGYGKQTRRKKDLLQLTHEDDIGYDLTTSLLVEADSGVTLAPMQVSVRTSDASTVRPSIRQAWTNITWTISNRRWTKRPGGSFLVGLCT